MVDFDCRQRRFVSAADNVPRSNYSGELSQALVHLSSDIRVEMNVLECEIKDEIQKEERDQVALELQIMVLADRGLC